LLRLAEKSVVAESVKRRIKEEEGERK